MRILSMESNILFIADGPLSNPILHSQGIPLLKSVSSKNVKAVFLTLENEKSIAGYDNLLSRLQDKKQNNLIFKYALIKKIKPVPQVINYFFFAGRKANREISENNIKIVHARSLFPAIIALAIKKFFNCNIRILYDIRGVLIDEEIFKGSWKESGLGVKILRRLEVKLLRESDQIVVVSDFFKKYLINKFSGKINKLAEKITVINNKTRLQDSLSVGSLIDLKAPDKIVSVYSGSAAYWQNVDGLFEFFRQSIAVFPNIEFRVISYDNSVFQKYMMENKEVADHLTIINSNSGEVKIHLAECNFGILLREDNLINNVASPLKFGEYLAAGLPVLVSRGIGDTEAIIRKYNVGVVLEDKNYEEALIKMMNLLNDPDIYERCRRTAQKEFNIEDSIKAYSDIYRTMLKN
jgi:glycosyltransferase involved in cell wall biosynthesis